MDKYSIRGAFTIPYAFGGKNRTRSEIPGYFDYFDNLEGKNQQLKKHLDLFFFWGGELGSCLGESMDIYGCWGNL